MTTPTDEALERELREIAGGECECPTTGPRCDHCHYMDALRLAAAAGRRAAGEDGERLAFYEEHPDCVHYSWGRERWFLQEGEMVYYATFREAIDAARAAGEKG